VLGDEGGVDGGQVAERRGLAESLEELRVATADGAHDGVVEARPELERVPLRVEDVLELLLVVGTQQLRELLDPLPAEVLFDELQAGAEHAALDLLHALSADGSG
jgi:hypothetical protein